MKEQRSQECPEQQGMYDPSFEHDNCGIGAVVNIKGIKSHKTVEDALSIVENLEHRAGKDAEGKTGDGVGIMVQISHKFFSKECAKLGIELGGEREYGIGMFFLPQDELKRNQAKKMFEIIVDELPWLERSDHQSEGAGKQSTGEDAKHHAGIYPEAGGCGKGTGF